MFKKFIGLVLCLILCKLHSQQGACSKPLVSKFISILEAYSGSPTLSSFTTHGIVSNKGGIWITGLCEYPNGQSDYLLARFNDTGKVLFVKKLGTAGRESSYPISIASTPSGGAVIAGQSYETAIAAYAASVTSIDNKGNVKWFKKTPNNGNVGRYDAFRKVSVANNGDIYLSGTALQYNASNNILLACLDSSGMQKFLENIQLGSQGHAGAIALHNNGFYVSGWINGQTPMLIDVSKTGTINSVKTYSSSKSCVFTDMVLSNSGKLFVTGVYGTTDLFVGAIDLSSGSLIWQEYFKAGSSTYGAKILLLNEKLVVGFQTTGFGGTGPINGIAEFDTSGNLSWTKAINFNNGKFENHPTGPNMDKHISGGMVFCGVDNTSKDPRFSLAITNPCDIQFCTNAIKTFSSSGNTSLSVSAGTVKRNDNGNFVDVNPIFQSITFSDFERCKSCTKPKKLLPDNVSLCENVSRVVISAQQTDSCKYLWSTGETKASISVSKTGMYIVSISNYCDTTLDTVVVFDNYLPKSPNLPDTSFCGNQWSYKLNIKKPYEKYLWNDGSTSGLRNLFNSGEYWVKISNSCGVVIDTFDVLQIANVSHLVDLKDVSICGQTSYTPSFVPVFGQNYRWNDGDTNAIRTFSDSGLKILTITNACGFINDSFLITIIFKPQKVPVKDTFFCADPVRFRLNLYQPNVQYFWTDGDTAMIKTFTRAGKFYVQMTNQCGTRVDSVLILREYFPVKTIKNEEYYCEGKIITVKGHQPIAAYYEYLWSNGNKTPEVVVSKSQTLTLKTTNGCGSRLDTVKVYLYPGDCNCEICIPNAFTPRNSDGRNDFWVPRMDCKYTKCFVKSGTYKIYNRWGEKIIENPVETPWDGTLPNGELVANGVYLYIVNVIFDETVSGQRIMSKSGTIHVLSGSK